MCARGRDRLEIQDFFNMLEGAFDIIAQPFNSAWADYYASINTTSSGYAGWEETILKQVVDLHEMNEAGSLDSELRYFGLKSPRGAQFYNFRPCPYLDCAAAGAISECQIGKLTRQSYIPLQGEVGVADEDGMITIEFKELKVIPNPIVAMNTLSWDDFRHFLWCGQHFFE